jgi:very-short-patch-repair endonuclease
MRKNLTPAEARVWVIVRRDALGYRFRRQHRIGEFIVDFVCPDRRLVVELDGAQHEDNPSDKQRDRYLRSRGYRVLRLWNQQVFSAEWTTETIQRWLDDPSLGTDGESWVYE